jgi:hypothetical protein
LLSAGKAADIVLIDAPDGGTQRDALSAIRNGDIAAVGAVVSAGEPRFVGRSRNTPGTMRAIRVVSCRLSRDRSRGRAVAHSDLGGPPADFGTFIACVLIVEPFAPALLARGRHRQDGSFACGVALVQFRGQIAGPKIKR